MSSCSWKSRRSAGKINAEINQHKTVNILQLPEEGNVRDGPAPRALARDVGNQAWQSWGLKGKDWNLPNTTLPSNIAFLSEKKKCCKNIFWWSLFLKLQSQCVLNIEKLENKEKLGEIKITNNNIKEKRIAFDILWVLFQCDSLAGYSLSVHPRTPTYTQHFLHNKTHPPHTFGLFCNTNAS